MKKHLPMIIVIVVFLCGLSLFLYPTVSNIYNQHLNNKLIKDYKECFSTTSKKEVNEAKEAAIAYNQNINNQEKLKELGLTYEKVLNVANNGVMGYVEIPKISASLIIYHTIEEEVLQKGIGHLPETHLPIGGVSTHCVLAGHTGLPSAKLLTNIDHLKIGDRFYVHTLNEVLEYKIDDISVVEPDEVSRLNVISGKDCVTLVTCTPYGVNSHRLLVRGVRVGNGSLSANEDNVTNEILNIDVKYLLTFSLIGLCIIFIAVKKIVSMKKGARRQKRMAVNHKMKKLIKAITAIIFVAFLLNAVFICSADNGFGNVTVKLENKDKEIINDVDIHICKIAGMDDSGYILSDAFLNSGISLSAIIDSPNETNAKTVKEYVKEKNITTVSKTSKEGKAVFPNIDKGIWLIFCGENEKYTFNPYFIFVPFLDSGKLSYDVVSTPKIEEIKDNSSSVYVIKKWDDNNNIANKRPESITVDLLENGNVVSTATLNEAGGWAHTFTGLQKDKVYSVSEHQVEDYTVQYSGDMENGFIITNSYNGEKLPQTGQYWWPIILISIAGVGFITLGIIELELSKNGKKDK